MRNCSSTNVYRSATCFCIMICFRMERRSKTNAHQTDEGYGECRPADGGRVTGIGASFLLRRVRPEQASHAGGHGGHDGVGEPALLAANRCAEARRLGRAVEN